MHGVEDNMAEHTAAGEGDGSSVTSMRGDRQDAREHDSQDVFVAEVLLEAYRARKAPSGTAASIEAST